MAPHEDQEGVVLAAGEYELAAVAPRHIRHRSTLSREAFDLEEATALIHSGSSPKRDSAPACVAEETDGPGFAALHKRRRGRIGCCVSALLLFTLLCLLLLSAWGVGDPKHARCRTMHIRAGALLTATLPVSPCNGIAPRFATPVLRVNDVQVIGTHNSYHIAPGFAISNAWKYTHGSLGAQLDAGVRSLELDVHYDPVFRTFSTYHEPFVDAGTRCVCLTDCLQEVVLWSRAHPDHTLIKLVLEPKYNIDVINPYHGGLTVHLRALQETILSSLPAESVLAPQAVQGSAPSLRAAVISNDGAPVCGWPSDAETRGSFLFILNAWQENAAAGVALRNLDISERLFFIRASEAWNIPDDAVVLEVDACACDKATLSDTQGCVDSFKRLVRAGYLVRAATDVAACAALDTAALKTGVAAAGVQLLTTDFIDRSALPCGAAHVACCVPGSRAACTAEGMEAAL